MEYNYLQNIHFPCDLKQLPLEALPKVCQEVRDFIIQELSHNPGHLGSSLGTVELTIALHYVFDTPKDQLVWDVGHQAYAHKILTGRRERFHTNRQYKGLAPFPTPAESEYDAFVAGHASNSISAALGIAVGDEAKKRNGDEAAKRCVVAIIGDGAMTGGLAFEGLNNTSMLRNNLLIVLNDNNMSIDRAVGGMTNYLMQLQTSNLYNRLRYKFARKMTQWGWMNENNRRSILRFNNSIKALLTNQQNVFEGMNIRYIGPVNGHDVVDLVRILNEIKDMKGPKLLHLHTIKGKGFKQAEENPTIWHAPGLFDADNGQRTTDNGGLRPPRFQDVFGDTLLELAKQNDKIVGITPAMPTGCSMNTMMKAMPERTFDVGIAEGHAVTFSAGIAAAGGRPFCNIYSSFMQRAYDNVIHDVALQNLHNKIGIGNIISDRMSNDNSYIIIILDHAQWHHTLSHSSHLRPVVWIHYRSHYIPAKGRTYLIEKVINNCPTPLVLVRTYFQRSALGRKPTMELRRYTRCQVTTCHCRSEQEYLISVILYKFAQKRGLRQCGISRKAHIIEKMQLVYSIPEHLSRNRRKFMPSSNRFKFNAEPISQTTAFAQKFKADRSHPCPVHFAVNQYIVHNIILLYGYQGVLPQEP